MLGVYRPGSRNGVHISDQRLATLIHMHMFDADSLRADRRKGSVSGGSPKPAKHRHGRAMRAGHLDDEGALDLILFSQTPGRAIAAIGAPRSPP
jgi:hypothetical protein